METLILITIGVVMLCFGFKLAYDTGKMAATVMILREEGYKSTLSTVGSFALCLLTFLGSAFINTIGLVAILMAFGVIK